MVIVDEHDAEYATRPHAGPDMAGAGEGWLGPPRALGPRAPSVKTEAARFLVRHDLESRIAFLEKICFQADHFRNPLIAARYARALRDAEEELLLLLLPPVGL